MNRPGPLQVSHEGQRSIVSEEAFPGGKSQIMFQQGHIFSLFTGLAPSWTSVRRTDIFSINPSECFVVNHADSISFSNRFYHLLRGISHRAAGDECQAGFRERFFSSVNIVAFQPHD